MNAMVSLAYVGNKGTRLPSQISPINVLNPKLLSQYGSKLTDQFAAGDASVDGVQAALRGLGTTSCWPSTTAHPPWLRRCCPSRSIAAASRA